MGNMNKQIDIMKDGLENLLPVAKNKKYKYTHVIKPSESWLWCCKSVIPALGRWRQEVSEFKANLDYIGRPHLKKPRAGMVAQW
jgi:hypothetical protein